MKAKNPLKVNWHISIWHGVIIMNDAYNSYWTSFVDAKIAEEYYFLYIHHSRVFLWGINVICMATSFTGVVALITSYLPNLASSIIILVPQLISLFQPFYPFGDRLYAAMRVLSARLHGTPLPLRQQRA